MDSEALVVPGALAKRLREEAKRLGVAPEELLADMLLRDLDPPEASKTYIEAALQLLDEALVELGEGDVRQAAEKLWGAAALAVKAYAAWREGRRLSSHGELWEYKRRLEKELGSWVSDAWAHANAMDTCFYEGWCGREDVEDAYSRVKRLVREVAKKILG